MKLDWHDDGGCAEHGVMQGQLREPYGALCAIGLLVKR